MGKSNQAGTVKYYFWVHSEKPELWYVSRISSINPRAFEFFCLKYCRWESSATMSYSELEDDDEFFCEHVQISEKQAVKCIIGGPEYCHKFQKKVKERAGK